jgi:hypothetical protein
VYPPLRYRLGLWVERTGWLYALVTALERAVKRALFGCRMCGQCALSQTGLVCPMTCPKQLRNGPCGGSVGGKCEVYPALDCVWTVAYRSSQRLGRGAAFHRLMLPVDHTLEGRSSWINHFTGRDAHTYGGRELPEPPLVGVVPAGRAGVAEVGKQAS